MPGLFDPPPEDAGGPLTEAEFFDTMRRIRDAPPAPMPPLLVSPKTFESGRANGVDARRVQAWTEGELAQTPWWRPFRRRYLADAADDRRRFADMMARYFGT